LVAVQHISATSSRSRYVRRRLGSGTYTSTDMQLQRLPTAEHEFKMLHVWLSPNFGKVAICDTAATQNAARNQATYLAFAVVSGCALNSGAGTMAGV
jgi:hypothetical protein